MTSWVRAFEFGYLLLQDRSRAENELPIGHRGELSLVEMDDVASASRSVCFVNWKSEGASRQGQVVVIDSHGRIVYSPPSLRPFRDLEAFRVRVIHPAVGACMERVSARWRPSLPPGIGCLKRMWEVVLADGCLSETGSLAIQCNGCRAATGVAVKQCPLCLLSCHSGCFEVASRPLRERVDPTPLPVEFRVPGVLCGLCTLHVAF